MSLSAGMFKGPSLYLSPEKTALTEDDVANYKTFIIYFNELDSVEDDVAAYTGH